MLVSASERFCAAAWVPGGYAAVTLSTRLLLEDDGLGAWAEGPCAGAPAFDASQAQHHLLALTGKIILLGLSNFPHWCRIMGGYAAVLLSTMHGA